MGFGEEKENDVNTNRYKPFNLDSGQRGIS